VTTDFLFHATSTAFSVWINIFTQPLQIFFVALLLNQNKYGENQPTSRAASKSKQIAKSHGLKIKTNVHSLHGKNLLILTEKRTVTTVSF